MSRKNLLVLGLVLSIGVNLFLIGGIAIRINNVRDYTQARPFPPNVGWIIRDLDEARQEELAELLEPLGEQVEPFRRAMMDAQLQVNRLMSSSNLSEAELSNAFNKLRDAAQAYTAITHGDAVGVNKTGGRHHWSWSNTSGLPEDCRGDTR